MGDLLRESREDRSATSDAALAAALVEESRDALIALSPAGEILSWNGGAAAMLGYSAEDAVGRPIEDFAAPAHRGGTSRALDSALREGAARFTTVRRARSGADVELDVALRVIRDASGRVRFVAAHERDLAELRRACERPDGQPQRPGELVARMAHELRTPLNAIIGFAEVIHDGHVAPDSPRVHEFAGDILASALRLLQLINDIVELEKAEAGTLDLRAADLDVAALVGETIESLRLSAGGKTVELVAHVDPLLGRMTLDPARLKRVLSCLLANAVDRTPAGGRVTMRALARGDDAFVIEMEDAGAGFAPDELEGAFLPFRPRGAAKATGSSVGLALAKRIVEALGGSVGVRSPQGGATVFHTTLPRRPQAPSGAALDSSRRAS